MRARLRLLLRFALVGLAATTLGAKGCDGDVVSDPTFRDWCGDSLCGWKLEAGSVRRAPTWHEKDFGVELVETPTAISQSTKDSPRCLVFTSIADVEPSAEVTIGLDFDRDGTIDHEEAIAATGFRAARTEISAPAKYDGLRIVVTKKGAGRAVLAQMRVQASTTCSAPALVLSNLPLGSPCGAVNRGAECASHVCCGGLCSECCAPGAEGRALPDGGVILDAPVACADGGACARYPLARTEDPFTPAIPLECDPGRRARPSGAPCLGDEDCASGACEGVVARRDLLDGGVAECDPALRIDASTTSGGGAGAGDCTFASITGGRCR